MQSSTQIQVSDKRKETGDWSIFDRSSCVKEEKAVNIQQKHAQNETVKYVQFYSPGAYFREH